MEDGAFRRLVKEIEDVGFIEFPQVVPMVDGTYRIIGGEHRIEAARELEYETVPCIVLGEEKWTEEELQQLVTVRLNVLKGKTDPGRMAQLYDAYARKYGKECLQELFAYTDQSGWQKMLDEIGRAVKSVVKDPEKQKEYEAKAKEAKTARDLEGILNELFASYGDTVDQNFMVFVHGRKEHIYIAMDKPTQKAMKKVIKYATESKDDINALVGTAMQELAKALTPSRKSKKVKNPGSDSVEF